MSPVDGDVAGAVEAGADAAEEVVAVEAVEASLGAACLSVG